MAYKHILVERSDEGFATLILNRPDRLNTLSIGLRQEMAQAVDALEADAAVRVLILTGAGRAFTAGLDLDEWAAPEVVAAGAYEHDAVAALLRFSGPLIGAINGIAVTGGLEIALACDLLIASTEARFADTHVQVGLLPGWGGSVRLAERVGLNRAKELALTGRFLGAEEAAAWGMVNHVVVPDRLRFEAEAIARQMLMGVPDALVAYKRLLDNGARLSFAEALRMERAASLAMNTPVGRSEIDARLARLRERKV
ncbi:enoyl-CoA hydratase [Variovorax sp. J22P168]|uniref:enoyl-CoA hydratase n=1 Tax=Variovorax jilinensis TaxID=3053513 RepID=UPI002577BF9A|nr:enoyl-CoA hydratase [Variovorax sp. J22P168]MDM0015101.1 enoyl-CoA hydratase [Variovorax sp. J22P168]